MKVELESVDKQDRLPLRAFMHAIRRTALHVHPEIEVLFVLKGSVSVRIEGRLFMAGPGDLVLVNSSETHLSQDEGGENVVLAIQLDRSLIGRFDGALENRRFAFNEAYAADPKKPVFEQIRIVCARLLWETRLKGAGYQLAAEGLALELCALIVRHFESAEAAGDKGASAFEGDASLFYSRINRLVSYAERHYRDRISLAEIARKEGLNMTYLSRFFKEKTGCSFTEFIQSIRLKKSLDALEAGDRKVVDIALDCGFPNVKSYNLVFRRTYGKTPIQWREERRGDAGENAAAAPASGAYDAHDAADALSLIRRYIE